MTGTKIILFISFFFNILNTQAQTFSFFNKDFKTGDTLIRDELFTPDCAIDIKFIPFIDSLGNFLTQNKNVHLIIEFHTDIRGSAKLNKSRTDVCGKERVGGYIFQKYKIGEDQITYKSFGEERPIISQKEIDKIHDKKLKDAAYARNRRTVVIISAT